MVDLNATQAAIRAGYSAKTAQEQGSQLLSKLMVQDAIAELVKARSERTQITADMVLTELARLAFANMWDFMRIGDDGDPYVDMSAITKEQTTALAEFTCEEFKDGRGEDARDVRRVKIRLHPKLPALVELGKHLGLFKGEQAPAEKPDRINLQLLLAEHDPARMDVLKKFLPKPAPAKDS